MFEASVSEFPFVAELPKREKSKLAQIWDVMKQMAAVPDEEGTLLPVSMACKALCISRTRVDQLVQDGKLKRFEFDGHVFISYKSVVAWAQAEHKNGRPFNKSPALMTAAYLPPGKY